MNKTVATIAAAILFASALMGGISTIAAAGQQEQGIVSQAIERLREGHESLEGDSALVKKACDAVAEKAAEALAGARASAKVEVLEGGEGKAPSVGRIEQNVVKNIALGNSEVRGKTAHMVKAPVMPAL